ncbi:MAG: radical SAM protein [Syntrophobacteraceae bacterium]
MPEPHRPSGILLQWHVTDRCNLRCAHCYQDSYSGEEPGFSGLLSILDQFGELLASWNRRGAAPVKAHITVTGGEPFLRPDFMDLLEVFHARGNLFTFAILSNGTLIDRATAQLLKKLRPSFVQVSVEGRRETHDRIRGEGAFDRAVAALRLLAREGVRTLVSFTAHRDNYTEFPQVAAMARELKVSRVWADRFIPPSAGPPPASGPQSPAPLSPEETLLFFHLMHQVRSSMKRRWLSFRQTEVAMHRGLQFLAGGGAPYRCTAGDSLIALLPGGDVLPCRRIPIRAGNVLEKPLAEIYHGSEILRALRDRDRIAGGCRTCFFAKTCHGGLRCLAYAMTGSPFEADPGCPLAGPKD